MVRDRSVTALQRQAERWWTKLQGMGYKLCSDHSHATDHECVTECPTIVTTIAAYRERVPNGGYSVEQSENLLGWAGPRTVFLRVMGGRSLTISDTLIHELLHYCVPSLPHWKVDWLAAQFVRGRTGTRIMKVKTQREVWAMSERKRIRKAIRHYQAQIVELRKQLKAIQ